MTGEHIAQTRVTRTVTMLPGQIYEISLTIPPETAGLVINAGTPDAIALMSGDTAVIRVRCVPDAGAKAAPLPVSPPPPLEPAAIQTVAA